MIIRFRRRLPLNNQGAELGRARKLGSKRWLPIGMAIGFVVACVVSGGAAFGYFSSTQQTQTNTFDNGKLVPATNFTASSVTSSSASLSWTAAAFPPGATITNWTITQSPGTIAGTCAGSEPVNPCTVTGLSPSTLYTWTITYFDQNWQAITTTSATTQAGGGTFAGLSGPVCNTNSQNNVSIPYPTGTASGDLVLLIVTNNATQTSDFSQGGNSTGWTAVSTAGGYPPQQNGTVSQQLVQEFWHQAGAETSVNFRMQTNSSGSCGWVLDYKGLVTPIAQAGTAVFGTPANGTSMTPAAITTNAANATVVTFASIVATGATAVAPTLGTANGFTRHVNQTASPAAGGPSIGLSVADQNAATAGSVTSPTWTMATSSQWAYITAAFT